MQLCGDCLAAEKAPFHPIYRHPRACCMARAIWDEPTRERRRDFAKRVKALVTAEEWEDILSRIEELKAKAA